MAYFEYHGCPVDFYVKNLNITNSISNVMIYILIFQTNYRRIS